MRKPCGNALPLWWVVVLLIGALGILAGSARLAVAQGLRTAQWVWYPEGRPEVAAPAATRYFRARFTWSVQGHAQFAVACDGAFVLYCNGRELGRGAGTNPISYLKTSAFIENRENIVAVEVTNDIGPAGLLVWGSVIGSGTEVEVASDATWKCTDRIEAGWKGRNFDDSSWHSVKVLGPEGETPPWTGIRFHRQMESRFHAAPGFRVETFATPEQTGSVICMTLDSESRPIISRELGPIFRLLDSDGDTLCDTVVAITDRVTNCQGLCEARKGLLYAIGQGPDGVGLYRIADQTGDEIADTVETVLRFDLPRMMEHGAHAVVWGPDGMLYLSLGNQAQPLAGTVDPHTPLTLFYEGVYPVALPTPTNFGWAGDTYRLPAGTILRVDPDRSVWSRIAGGLRNAYDLAFDQNAEIFTYDSDMDWDYELPWYRPVRANHIVPGADYGWRAGSGMWPAYFADSLPALDNVGHCSPTGLMVYRHYQFPAAYENNLIMCDWSRGQLLALRLKRNGATYLAERRTLATGAPLNVTDTDVGSDGSLYFATGGRGTIGGVYRVVATDPRATRTPVVSETLLERAIHMPQPQSAWARARLRSIQSELGTDWADGLAAVVRDPNRSARDVLASLDLLDGFGPRPSEPLLREALEHGSDEVRGRAAVMLGQGHTQTAAWMLTGLLRDVSPIVRRRASEALVQCGFLVKPDDIFPLLGDKDRWTRYAARLLLERIPVATWRQRALAETDPLTQIHALLALVRLSPDRADLRSLLVAENKLLQQPLEPNTSLDLVRVIQLTLLKHRPEKSPEVWQLARRLERRFPSGDWRLDREIARVLAALPDQQTAELLLKALLSTDEQEQQIHLTHYLVYIETGWSREHVDQLLSWFEATACNPQGRSFKRRGVVEAPYTQYLEAMCARLLHWQSDADKLAILDASDRRPFVARVLVSRLDERFLNRAAPTLMRLVRENPENKTTRLPDKLIAAILDRLARSPSDATITVLTQLWDQAPAQREQIARAVTTYPEEKKFELLLAALDAQDASTQLAAIRGQQSLRAARQDAEPLRRVLEVAGRLGPLGADSAIRLVEEWTGQNFRLAKSGWVDALHSADAWYAKTFPNAAPVAKFTVPKQTAWTYEDLSSRLLDPAELRDTSVFRGIQVMEKSRCLLCHQFGDAGELKVGPDLTTVGKRLDRSQLLESTLYPSRVVSDQYQSVAVVLASGRVVIGRPVSETGETVTLVDSEGVKVTLSKTEIEQTKVTDQSVMPTGMLDQLTLEEIANLLRALVTGPPKK